MSPVKAIMVQAEVKKSFKYSTIVIYYFKVAQTKNTCNCDSRVVNYDRRRFIRYCRVGSTLLLITICVNAVVNRIEQIG